MVAKQYSVHLHNPVCLWKSIVSDSPAHTTLATEDGDEIPNSCQLLIGLMMVLCEVFSLVQTHLHIRSNKPLSVMNLSQRLHT